MMFNFFSEFLTNIIAQCLCGHRDRIIVYLDLVHIAVCARDVTNLLHRFHLIFWILCGTLFLYSIIGRMATIAHHTIDDNFLIFKAHDRANVLQKGVEPRIRDEHSCLPINGTCDKLHRLANSSHDIHILSKDNERSQNARHVTLSVLQFSLCHIRRLCPLGR